MENLPLGRNAIGNKWVIKVKAKQDGSVDRFKDRPVAKGFNPRALVDYFETFSPVVKLIHRCQTEYAYALGRHRSCVPQRIPPRGYLHAPTRRGIGWNTSSHAPPEKHLWTETRLARMAQVFPSNPLMPRTQANDV
jgi:hypothetical protein